MSEVAIELRGVSKAYGRKQVLTGLDLAVPKGAVLGLLGTNGAGKTTLIKCALGLIRPQCGDHSRRHAGRRTEICRGWLGGFSSPIP